MGSDDWYRNSAWSAETEAAFDAKLARSRTQKAQYLRIQGSILKDSEPLAAIRLLRRCVETDDVFQIAAAYLDMGHAHYVAGDVDAALVALEAAIEQQRREPMFRTSAPYDYAMLVALHDRSERYAPALAFLERSDDAFFSVMVFQSEAARAVIYAALGRTTDAKAAAIRALEAEGERVGWIPGFPSVGVVPDADNPLTRRVREIAGSGET